MNEKVYKAMNFAGVANIVVGVIVAIIGVTAGIISAEKESFSAGRYGQNRL